MSRLVLSVLVSSALVFALPGTGPALAKGTTPPITWLLVIKDVVRKKLNSPKYVSFGLIFQGNKKTDSGAVPVCGFADHKQNRGDHAVKVPFFGLLTPPDAGKAAAFASVQFGETDEQAQQIAKACKDNDIY